MEQQMDAFTQRRFELMIEMSTKKLQNEINSIKETLCSLSGELNSLKSQISRLQFQPPQKHAIQTTFWEPKQDSHTIQPRKEVKIVDCRPEDERKQDFKSGAEKNAEPVKPRYGDYKPDDVSIDKFFYFGRK